MEIFSGECAALTRKQTVKNLKQEVEKKRNYWHFFLRNLKYQELKIFPCVYITTTVKHCIGFYSTVPCSTVHYGVLCVILLI